MTNPTPPPTEPVEPTEPVVEPVVEPVEEDQGGKTAAEAAKYRKRAAEERTAKESAQAEVAELRSSYVSQLVAGKLKDPSDFALNVSAETLVDPETGRLDPKLVEKALDGLLRAKPHLAAPPAPSNRRPTMPQGNPVGGRAPRATSEKGSLAERFGATEDATWSSVLDRQSDTRERATARSGKTRLRLTADE